MVHHAGARAHGQMTGLSHALAVLVALLVGAACASGQARGGFPGLRSTDYRNFTADMFSHTPAHTDMALVGNEAKVFRQFYSVTGNPALKFSDFAFDWNIRAPCTFTPPHYHAYGAELSINTGPDDSQYMLMVAEDMSKAYFFKCQPFSTVTVPQGWLHVIVNTCGRVRNLIVFNGYQPGLTHVPWEGKLAIDPAKVSLSGATQEEFKRIYKWVQDSDINASVPPVIVDRSLGQTCLDYCAKADTAPAPKLVVGRR